jgi:hypothetical protein
MKRIITLFTVATCIGVIAICSAAKPLSTAVMEKYSTGTLEGRTLSDLYARYLGVGNRTIIGKYINIDFQRNFEAMWQKKNLRCNSTVVKQASQKLINEYSQHATFTSFNEYKNHVTVVVNELKRNINWGVVKNKTNLSQKDVDLVKAITVSFNGQDMTAYILTELMPSSDGALNVKMLDFILRNAGKEYIEGIPALYDQKTSFGPYQFTEYAVYATPREKRGASVVNEAVSANEKIPGSVIRLRGDDHHRAAFLFAIYNLCEMVKALNGTEKKVLESYWKRNKDDLFFYCATAHHNPAAARKAARTWLDHKMRYSFERSCNRRIVGYAEKTRKNLAAM